MVIQPLTKEEILQKVKIALGFKGSNYHDDILTIYIDEIISELIGSGVPKIVAESNAAIGCITIGVNDLWNYTGGDVKHSDYFNRRLIQLSKIIVETEGDSDVQT